MHARVQMKTRFLQTQYTTVEQGRGPLCSCPHILHPLRGLGVSLGYQGAPVDPLCIMHRAPRVPAPSQPRNQHLLPQTKAEEIGVLSLQI